MAQGAHRGFATLQHLLDLVDTPAWPVELVAQQLVRGAGRVAEAAMHALADDRLGAVAGRGAANEIGQMRFHAFQISRYMRPGSRMPAGSNACLIRRCNCIIAGANG